MTDEQPPTRGVHTRAVHGPAPDPNLAAQAGTPMAAPLVRSATYAFASLDAMLAADHLGPAGAFYQRDGHPTVHATERRLAALEGAEAALLFSSGMAAISSLLLSLLAAGDKVVALRQVYGGTRTLLDWGRDRLGWRVEEVDAREPEAWEGVLDGARVLHVESPTNPTLCVVDLARAAELAHRHGARLTVDNTFASPVGQHPLALGADAVVYSATKSIGGHSDLLAGAVAGPAALVEEVWRARTTFGGMADPDTAWLIARSLKTLPMRVERQNANALALARRLERHPAVAAVFYAGLERHPGHAVARGQMTLGFGPVLSFDVRGGAAAAQAVVEGCALIHHAPSLGSIETLIVLPAHTSHRRLGPEGRARAGIPEGLVRLSVGIEDEADLWADLERALERARG